MTEYEPVIGLEVHCQTKTFTKMFCGATTVFGREPNTQVDTVSLGLPGVLPVINASAVEQAVKAGLALGCEIREHSTFDRKHYFYPDLPKGYQITQYESPYCVRGGVNALLEDGTNKFINLTRIHMEEDAGKLMHQDSGAFSEVDLNRAGVPLIEIVSEPEIRSAAEAYAYLTELKRILKWVEAGECEMQEGSLRCDANVSVRPKGQEKFGTRIEIKNLNSFRAVEAAITYEINNQIALIRAGRGAEIVQETKLWDPDSKTTKSMRGKEQAAEYRYFPDPDLPPLKLSAEYIERIRSGMPELPGAREARFVRDYGIEPGTARELTSDRSVADYTEALIKLGVKAKLAANWTREEAMRLADVSKKDIGNAAPLSTMAKLLLLVEGGKVARVVAKGECAELFTTRLANGEPEDPETYFTRKGMIQVQDAGQLSAWVSQIIAQEAKAVADIRAGKLTAAGRLVGSTMKLSGGKADPAAIKAEVSKQLGVEL